MVSSCSGEKITDLQTDFTADSVAASYVDNLFKRSDEEARMAGNPYSDYSYFEEETVLNSAGEYVYFEELSEREKEAYVTEYQRKYREQLEEKLKQTPEMIYILGVYNEAVSMTLKEEYETEEEMYEALERNFASLYVEQDAVNSARSGVKNDTAEKPVTENTYNEDSFEVFKENYKKGYVLVYPSYEGSGSGFGHCSMMSEESFDGNITVKEEDGTESTYFSALAKAGITSFPRDKGATWEGKTDGVQKEPWGYWCSYPSKVYIMKVVDSDGNEASDTEYAKAVDFAVSKIGKPYSKNFLLKTLESKFYCSSLIFQSWKHVGIQENNKSKFYIGNSNISVVSPLDVYASDKTKLVATFYN